MNVKEFKEALEAVIKKRRVDINIILDDYTSKTIQNKLFEAAMTKGYVVEPLADNEVYLILKLEDRIFSLKDIILCNKLKDEDITNELLKTITDEIYNTPDEATKKLIKKFSVDLKEKFRSLPLGLCKDKTDMKECSGCIFNKSNSIIRCGYIETLDKDNLCTSTCPICGSITLEEEVTSSNPGAMTECTNKDCDYRCNQFLDYEDFKRL